MKYNILELFKGTGSVGKVATKMNMNSISLDFIEKYEPDILVDILEWDYKKWQKKNKYIPDFIWASPPCNTYSPLAYPLKERNPKTAKPYSERAKIGTLILYKTLEIINYFLKLNPNLLFVIENPKGMMRNDKIMKKLNLSTTCYCLYGDKKRKLTDFFNNVPDGLNLKEVAPCPNPDKIISVVDLKLDDRYSIPPKLIKAILNKLVKEY
jgi:hypothetical protein